jgi:hypothetical protein
VKGREEGREGKTEVRGRRGRAEEEEGRRRRRALVTPDAVAPVGVGVERDRLGERGGSHKKNLEGESGVVVYICFSEFGREARETEKKREKPIRSTRIACRRESDYGQKHSDDVDGVSVGESDAVYKLKKIKKTRTYIKALFRFPNLVTKFTMQNFYSPSHQNADTYMEY